MIDKCNVAKYWTNSDNNCANNQEIICNSYAFDLKAVFVSVPTYNNMAAFIFAVTIGCLWWKTGEKGG